MSSAENTLAEAPKPLDRSPSDYWRGLADEFDRQFPESMNEPMRATWQFVHDLLAGAPHPSQSWRHEFLEAFTLSALPMFAELAAALAARQARPDDAEARLARVDGAFNDAWNYYLARDHFTNRERGAIEALEKIKKALTA